MKAETARGVRRCGCHNCRHQLAVELAEDREVRKFTHDLERFDFLSDLAMFEPGGISTLSVVERIDAYYLTRKF